MMDKEWGMGSSNQVYKGDREVVSIRVEVCFPILHRR